MEVRRVHELAEFERLADRWNSLEPRTPMSSWPWLSTWWTYYGAGRELYVLCVEDETGALVGIAPWFRGPTRHGPRTISALGSGEVCSDYPHILAPDRQLEVVEAISGWLTEARRGSDCWDQIVLECVPESDELIPALADSLARAGGQVHRRSGPGLWRIDLPDCWDSFVSRFSKNRRKRLRGFDRRLREGDICLRIVRSCDELPEALSTLIDLHHKRRSAMGDGSCFSSPAHLQFVRDVAPRLMEADALQLAVLEHEGRPIAVEYSLVDRTASYMYQCGIEPDASELSPGNLVTVGLLQHSISSGRSSYDLLRGDEPYKATWGAVRESTTRIHIAADRLLPQVRQRVWSAGLAVKDLIKTSLSQVPN